MKITAVDTCILTVPVPANRQMSLDFPSHRLVVATIRTNQGLEGLGYSLVFGGGGAESVLAYLDARNPATADTFSPVRPNRTCCMSSSVSGA